MALVEAGQARLLVAWESGQMVLWDWQKDTSLATVSLFSQVSYGMVWAGQGGWSLDRWCSGTGRWTHHWPVANVSLFSQVSSP